MKRYAPLSLTLAAGKGRYVVHLDGWRGAPLDPALREQLHQMLDDGIQVIGLKALQRLARTEEAEA